MRRLAVALAAISLPVALAHAADPTTVTASGTSFTPKSVTVPVGGTVRWQTGTGNHNVAFDDGSYRSGDPTTKADIGQRTFDTAGTFAYHCEVHGASGGLGMSGTVVVGEATTPTPDPTPTATVPPSHEHAMSDIVIRRSLSHGRLLGHLQAAPDGAKLRIAVTRDDHPVGAQTKTTDGLVHFRVKLARSVRRAVADGKHPKLRVDFKLTDGDETVVARRALRVRH